MGKLDGKYAVVTGGAKGIGEAIVKKFLEEGVAGVALVDWNGAQAEETAAKLDAKRCLAVGCDIANREQVKAAAEKIYAAFGRVDILVNNAGITRDAIFHKMTDDQWDAVLAVNLTGAYNMCKVFYPGMRDQNYGRIVNITSTSAFGNAGQTNYAASKAGIQGLTRSLAKEGARKGVVVNAIAPGYIETDMYNAVPEELRAKSRASIPMQRFGKPEEIAKVAVFLSSDDVSFMSAQTLIVSGAMQTS